MTLEVFSKSGTTSFPADAFENSETNHRKQSGYDRENSQDKTLLVKFFIKNRVSLYRNYVFNTFICPVRVASIQQQFVMHRCRQSRAGLDVR